MATSKNVDSSQNARRGGPKKPEFMLQSMRIFWVRNAAGWLLAAFLEVA